MSPKQWTRRVYVKCLPWASQGMGINLSGIAAIIYLLFWILIRGVIH
jgi:hypothetical protein